MARIRTSLEISKKKKNCRVIWRIALYIRLSREDGNDESLSVINQRKILTDFLSDEFVGEYNLVDYYVDDGVTGTDYERPHFQRMLRDIEAGNVNCMICKNLSRAFRNYSDQGYFLENFFPLHGTRFVTLGDPKVDSYLNPEVIQGLEVPINGLLNDRYAAKTSHDVRRTFDNKRKNGEFIGAFAPFGYQKCKEDKNRFSIDDEAAPVVRDIFRWYAQDGMSKAGIAKRLNEMGIPNPAAYKRKMGLRFASPTSCKNDGMWSPKTIRDILLNQMYIGNMVQGKQKVISYKVHDRVSTPQDEWYVVENTHDPIVDRAVFDAAQSLHNRDTRAAPAHQEVYLFSGFVRCGDCGKAMTRRTAKGYVYYACRTYQEKGKEKCSKHTIRLDTLEQAALVTIQKQIELVATLEEIIQEINNAPVVHTQSQRLTHLLKLRLQELEKARTIKDSLYVDWKMGELSREDYGRMKVKFETQIQQLEQTVAHLQEETRVMENGIPANDPYLDMFQRHQNIDHLERSILVELVENILVHENGAVEIELKFADQYRELLKITSVN